jgi:putative DNA primase/helicase
VPFTREIPEGERDPNVREALRNDPRHRAAVLAWIIEGAHRCRHEGLEAPEAVRKATECFKNDMDPLSEFLSAYCVIGGEKLWAPARELRDQYMKWCDENGVASSSMTRLSRSSVCGDPHIDRHNTHMWSGGG